MIRSRVRFSRSSRTALIAIFAVGVGVLANAASALAARPAQATRTVRYHGVSLQVPVSWPVFHLGARSTVCVRFNRHAVYLGAPGSNQICPRQAAGRTEAILVSPTSYHGALLTPLSTLAAGAIGAASGSDARITDGRQHVVITATWGADPATIRMALGLRSLRAAMLATNGHRPRAVAAPLRRPAIRAHTTSPESPATPGETYAGLGFDVCTTPSSSAMAAWGTSSPYAAIGIYIGGVNAACLGGNLTPSWVSSESVAGWHMIPIYVGLQAPGNSCGCQSLSATVTNGAYATATSEGTAAAQDAVAHAQALGIGTANPIYYDMENYKRSTSTSGAVLAFLQAWTAQLHASGYLSGVYSSGSSGIADLVANYGTTYVEPDELWTADWDASAPSSQPTSTANPYVPATDWPNNHQLLQYYSDAEGRSETYGGVTIGIDRDYVDAPTAAYGSGTLVSLIGTTPTLTIRPQANGSVNLTPRWAGEPGITQYAILGGASPLALSAVETVSATAKFPVKLQAVHAYYEVQALNSLAQVVGTSAPIQAPSSLAIFGRSAYVGARGPVGIPVACLNSSPCRLEAQIFDGTKRIAHSDIGRVSAHGGQLLVPLNNQTRRLIVSARHLPVTVTVTSATGAKVNRPLTLSAYTVSGRAPTRRTWPSSVLQILGSTSYVSNGWTGGVLAACRLSTPCVSTVQVTLGGVALAKRRTTTIGPGEIGYLTYNLNNRGHKLLRAELGNQLGARLSVSTSSPGTSSTATTTQPTTTTTNAPLSSGGSAAGGPKATMALISLVSFR
ncbi:MAG TPA: glycoside hydrolase domain-containing protein [Solirubrobacteraceae bacterium]|nr:glycoside hydrolase domain-containing protein [Solirubrobacteraceae bacterium]